MPPSPQTAFLPLMLLGSFSVARKSSLPVLICPEGCYYTFQASASQAGRAQQQRGRSGGAGEVGPLSYVLFLPPCSHTCQAGNKHGPSVPSCQHGLLMSLKEGISTVHLGQSALEDRDRQTPLHNQPLTPAHFSPDVCTVSFVNLRISQTWYCMSIIPVFRRWIEGWMSRVQGHPLLHNEFKDKPCLRQT